MAVSVPTSKVAVSLNLTDVRLGDEDTEAIQLCSQDCDEDRFVLTSLNIVEVEILRDELQTVISVVRAELEG